MQVDKQYFLGEALYRLSVYEKGGCSPSRIWWKKYVTRLKNSIILMDEMIRSISDENITSRDYEIVRKILERKEVFCFNELLLNQWEKSNYSLSAIPSLSSYQEVNRLMSTIIEQLGNAIESLSKRNKKEIWYSLQALHNLPKVYFRSQQESMFENPIPPISCAVALECAQIYLK